MKESYLWSTKYLFDGVLAGAGSSVADQDGSVSVDTGAAFCLNWNENKTFRGEINRTQSICISSQFTRNGFI